VERVTGFDHVAITVADIDESCDFYRDVLGARHVNEYVVDGRVAIRQIAVGDAVLSVHRLGNGLDLVAHRPTAGAADICMRWSANIESAVLLLQERGIEIIEGPAPRTTADGASSQSVYFRDPDGNLLELMAESSSRT
jgi:catechol 2,3-dioxygenase-like lactoylglutathione lyase family enzyme